MTTTQLGLTTEQAIANREMGTNKFTQREPKSWWMLLKETVTDRWYWTLYFFGIIMLILDSIEKNWNKSLNILIIVLVTQGISLCVGRKVDIQSVEKISFENEPYMVSVFRNNELTQIHSTEIVCGDCVLLNVTDKIPADGILLEGAVMVDQSIYSTSEKPVRKLVSSAPIPETHVGKVDSEGFCLRGSVVISGSAVLLVTEVGDNTELGKALA